MEPTMIDAEATGIILWHKAAFTLRVERSLLMLDAKSWAKWIATKKREEAARAARDGGISRLTEINQQIREIDRWLVTGRGTCQSTYVLHRRLLFAPPPVLHVTEDMSAGCATAGRRSRTSSRCRWTSSQASNFTWSWSCSTCPTSSITGSFRRNI